ncbi:hypothetical protein [Roseateles aquatilis]|nr:hypothetical protein [Roseateles aquatilis]
MNQATLLSHRDDGDWKDYHKLLRKFYQEVSDQRRTQYQQAYTAAFLTRHAVEGTVTKQKALDVARVRSNDGTRDFESTIVTPDLLAAVVLEVNSRFIAGHGAAFQTYQLREASGQLIHVSCKANQGFLVRQGKGSFNVGLNENGIINHLEASSYDNL